MLTVRATLEPNGHVVLPPALVQTKPVPVLVTFLEPLPDPAVPAEGSPAYVGKGSVANLRALLQSPEFLALPRSDPKEVEERIQAMRNDWNDE